MKCSNCGHENEENAKYCDSCGIELSKNKNNVTISYSKNEAMKTSDSATSLSGIFSILGGIISIIGSYKMTQIKSVSGNSIAETFYSSFGIFGIGFGMFMIGIGIYILSKTEK